MKQLLMALGIVFFITGGCQKEKQSEPQLDNFKLLSEWMTGSFSSQEQSLSDTNFYDIRLQMMPIWTDDKDGYWFYVEQAVAAYQDKPYRQRVYHLSKEDNNTFISDIYTLEYPERFTGQWKNDDFLSALSPDSLTLRDGCSIKLVKHSDSEFVGSTSGKNCNSSLRGAKYATSEVKVTPDFIYSWDRGYDSTDVQVWGAETGGYMFLKLKEPDTLNRY